MPWSSLPEELWKLILVHVPLMERLCSCSRVSKKLCRAAAAATEQLELRLGRNVQRSEGVVRWLQQHGQHVTSLEFEDFEDFALTELPCQQLRQLGVVYSMVQLGPSSSHPGVLHRSGLTKLTMKMCDVVDGSDGLTALSAVPAVQRLVLMRMVGPRYYEQLRLPGSTFQVLTQLTHLTLDESIRVTAESLQHISTLQHCCLQVLDITNPSVSLSTSSTPGLDQLTGLHTLRSANFNQPPLDAAVLQHYTRLQLKLYDGVLAGANNGDVMLSVFGQQLQLEQYCVCCAMSVASNSSSLHSPHSQPHAQSSNATTNLSMQQPLSFNDRWYHGLK